MTLEAQLAGIGEPDRAAMDAARRRWDRVAKPLHSLGLLEDHITQIAGIQGTDRPDIRKKALVIMCADNGIVREGVTQTGQEVTALVTSNFTKGEACACLMAELAGMDVFPVDIGVAGRLPKTGVRHPLIRRKIACGTRDFAVEPAMTREETVRAVRVGIGITEKLKREGYGIVATGEMGIGNTTTSSAVASVLLGREPERMTGKGAGLTDQGLNRKVTVIRDAIRLHRPNPGDGLDVLSKVGGLDLAGMAGVFLGGAICRLPVVIDGFISAAAALAAVTICEKAGAYLLASHVSAEPAGALLLEALGKRAVIHGGMFLGEGTGAAALMPLLDMAAAVYKQMSTFEEIHLEGYKPL